MAVVRKGNAFAPLPFDQIHDIRSGALRDTFVATTAQTATTTAAVVSELPWVLTEGAGDSVAEVTLVAPTDNHVGVISLDTGATTPADGDIAGLHLSNAVHLDENGIYLAALVRVPDVDAQKVFFGLAPAVVAVNSSAADSLGFVWDPEDAANVGDELWFAQSNAGGTDTEEVFTLSYTENDWVLLELAATDTDSYFRITTEDASETIHIDTDPTTVATLHPMFTVEAVGAAEEILVIDTFVMRWLIRQDHDSIGSPERMLIN